MRHLTLVLLTKDVLFTTLMTVIFALIGRQFIRIEARQVFREEREKLERKP